MGSECISRRHYGQRHLARPLNRRLERRAVLLLDVAEDVLQHDDRIVDHDADGERQREQRHVVQGEVHGAHQRERGHDRGGNRQG